MKKILRYAFLLASCGCFGGAATVPGQTNEYPLVRVDSVAIPKTISDASGNTTQVVNGKLVTSSSSISCDYEVNFSNGKVLKGTRTCSLVSDVQVVVDGLQFSLDAAEVGGPSGAHAYAFKTNTGSPICDCAHDCLAGKTCRGDRLLDSSRVAPASLREERTAVQ